MKGGKNVNMRRFIKVKSEIKPVGTGKNREEKCIIYPDFLITGKDIMRKGGNFYAILDTKTGMWSTNQNDLYRIIDEELYSYAETHFKEDGFGIRRDSKGHEVIIRNINDASTKILIEFNKWFNNLAPNHNYIPLDSDLTFLSDEVTPDMYRSKRLKYDLTDGNIDAYEQIFSVLYSDDDRQKLEWAIGSILSGDSKKIEKMVVLYGKKGTGKSTVIDLIEEIFDGYWHEFVAEELASKVHQFATAAFKDNPLVAIQDDGSLAKVDSPRINEIVSHRITQINEKNTKQYSIKPNAMLFLATNDLVDIHDTNMGIARRILDVYPTYRLLPVREYRRLVNQMMKFEIPAIAKHCLDVYKELGKEYYVGYEPKKMINKTNYLRNFILDNELELKNLGPVTRDMVYTMYVRYFEESGLGYPPKRIIFGEQLKEYYEVYEETKWLNGKTCRHVYSGLKKEIFEDSYDVSGKKPKEDKGWLKFNSEQSIFDEWCKDNDFKAQYDTGKKPPIIAWSKVKTTMKDINSHKLHWINIPVELNHIRVDFDFKNDAGEKDLEKNIEEANKFPPTYAEISQSGGGVHLHYFYGGDSLTLNSKYADNIEIKSDKGDAGCRRKLTRCNDMQIATIPVGSLPTKGEKDVVTEKDIKDEKHLRNRILYAMKKKGDIVSTAVGINYIYDSLKEAYDSGMHYDVSDMAQDVQAFANNSKNQKPECLKKFMKMKFRSKDFENLMPNVDGDSNWRAPQVNTEDKPIIFLDVEVWPNVFIVCWKLAGEDKSVTKLINPPADIVRNLYLNYWIIGFNNRDYDNHMLWAYGQGYTNYGLFTLSQRIIVKKDKNAKFGQAYGISYTDVYDFSNTKQGLKKWEIQLGIYHLENSYPWDEDLDPKHWDEAATYCANDVVATEKVFLHLHEDWTARKILALLSGLTVNDTTNSHTTKIIVGDTKEPWHEFEYTDLSEMFPGYEFDQNGIDQSRYDNPDNIVAGKSLYRGEDPGEGGYVYAEPGMYIDVALLDIASMHPNSALNLNIFGPYTERYRAIVNARLAIKHKEYDKALECLLTINPNVEDELRKYLSDGGNTKALAYALKIPINSVYGLTSAKFQNKLKDPRNVDNIVAKRGALFMINLKHEVQERGFTVAHIKTDSIKIPNATPEIIEFVMEYGKKYGYTFEHEATYKKMCLVNDAVYIAQYADGEHEFELPTGEKIMTSWTATGKEFQVPYIFKTLFCGKEINYGDLCQTINVKEGELYLDFDPDAEFNIDNMQFVGKVGSFVPVKEGKGLFRVKDEKKFAAPGTKGYRWALAESLRFNDDKFDMIDMSYFETMAEKAKDHINEFGDFDRFVNDQDYDPQFEKLVNVEEGMDEEIPFDPPFMNKPNVA